MKSLSTDRFPTGAAPYSAALRIALVYAAVGLAWILVTDLVVERVWRLEDRYPLIQTFKGAVFVLGSAALVYFLVHRERRAWERATRELQESRKLLESTFRSLDDALFVVEQPDRTIVGVNPAAERIFGRSRDELLGASTRILCPSEKVWRRFRETALAEIETSGVYRGEWEFCRADGSTFPAMVSLSVIRNDAGSAVAVVGVVWDFSERKELEEKLRASRDQIRRYALRLRAVREEERHLVARDLHDQLGGSLTALGMLVARLRPALADDEESQALIEEMETIARDALDDVRRITAQLRPPVLDELGLGAALQDLVAEVGERSEVAVGFEPPVGGDGLDLSDEAVVHLYRIVQEALTNVVRHAGADACRVTLSRDAATLRLTVEDDGIGFGFDTTPERAEGMGLIGMRERARSLGGSLQIRPREGGGTTVAAVVPVARVGGDEFMLLVEGLDEPGAVHRATERILEEVAAPFELDGSDVEMDVSLGAVLYSGRGDVGWEHAPHTDEAWADELVRRADLAMYRAKERPGSRCHVFDPAADGSDGHVLEREGALRRAVEREELEVHYQPVADLASGRVCGLEVLARWHSPEQGWISPGEFIPLAEETGLIEPLGQWILDRALGDFREKLSTSGTGESGLQLFVNLSPVQLDDPDLSGRIGRALERHDVDPARVSFEVTETAVTRSVDRVRSLRDLGVKVAIDDFGTGYSSLGNLRHFQVDTLKIDMEFVRGVGSNPEDEAIVRTIINLGKTLGTDVVAEGVEEDAQLGILRSLGCDRAQGYLFSRPLPLDDVLRLLADEPIWR
ncbi:MAG: EAL domain-containing protein [Gemmatimonadota bacterium]